MPRLSLAVASGSNSLVAVCRLPFTVASLVVECGLEGTWASVVGTHRFSGCSSWALEIGLSNCGAQA